MTLPDERIRAVQYTRQFLYDLMDPRKTPRVPKYVRLLARRLIKHYPGDMYLNSIFSDYHVRELVREAKSCKHTWVGTTTKCRYCTKCGKGT